MSETQRSRKERKELYEKVLRTVEVNTGGAQLAGQTRQHLKTLLCANCNNDPDHVENAVTAALENDDLLAWHDEEWDAQRLTRTEPDDLRRLATEAAERREDQELVGRTMQTLREVQADE